MAKEKKERADHYEKPLVVKGEFIDVVNAMLGVRPKPDAKPVKKVKKNG